MPDTNAPRKPTTLNDWDQFLETARPDIGHKQSTWWAEFLRKRGWDSFCVAARDGDAICGGATVLVKPFAPDQCSFYIPHGPVLPEQPEDAEELFCDLITYLDERRKEESRVVSHLRIEPRWHQQPPFVHGFDESSSWHEPRNTLLIDLSVSEDELLNQMKKKGRYNVRVAQRHQVSVVEDNSSRGINDFMTLYGDTAQRKEIRMHSRGYIRDLADILFPYNRGSIFFAEYEGKRLATALVLYFGSTATYKYGGSSHAHRNVMAPYLLHFEIMRKAKILGHQWYDLYGVAPPGQIGGAWANISAFKRKFGGCEQEYVPSLDLVYDPDAYAQFRGW